MIKKAQKAQSADPICLDALTQVQSLSQQKPSDRDQTFGIMQAAGLRTRPQRGRVRDADSTDADPIHFPFQL